MNGFDDLVRLLYGALLGGIIGFERQAHGRPAGLRTHILVSVASVLVMIVSRALPLDGSIPGADLRMDANRLAAGALTGIGFIGAGVILKSGANIQGLTTAASLWLTAILGLAVGAGLWAPATAALGVAILTLWSLRLLEGRVVRVRYRAMTVIERGNEGDEAVLAVLDKRRIRVVNVEYERDVERDESTYTMTLGLKGKTDLREILDEVSGLPSVKRVHIRN
jgi:putative Mg2+ transporter-C (MgtC) family protein